MAGIYLHVPFCHSFCIYCDFYSELNSKGLDRYADAVKKEMNLHKGYFKGVLPETLYFGGGTPSLLPLTMMKEITDAIKQTFGVSSFKEFTIEVNPDDIVGHKCCRGSSEVKAKLAGYRDIGVTRISMGVQSFDDSNLKWMNRRHTSAQAVDAILAIRDAGFDNLSIDLIFGYQGLSSESWDYSISKAIDMAPEHISCYQMSIEPGSALAQLARSGKYLEPSQEQCAEQYSYLQKRLSDAGYEQYEISNFSKPGFESLHNSSYWARAPYLGLGPSAHSFDGDKTRSWNVADTLKWEEGILSGKPEVGSEILSPEEIFNEQIMLGLRRAEGLSLSDMNPSMSDKIKPALTSQIKAGNIVLNNNSISIPKEKLFVSDSIMSELFL